MNGRTTAALAAMTMLMGGLAGCLTPSALLNSNEVKTEISASENRDLAENAAKAWDPAAKILGVFSVELSDAKDHDFPLDATPGNGKAPAWIYAFVSGKGDASRAFRVTADGRVVSENNSYDPAKMSGQKLEPLVDWKVDSTKAVDVASGDANFSAALYGNNLTLAEGVAQMDGITGWYLAAMSKGGSSVAIVNAANGALVAVHAFSMDFKMPTVGAKAFSRAQPIHVEGAGTVDSSKQKMEFPIEAAPGNVVLKLSANRQLPTDAMTWTLVDAQGQKVKSGNVGGFGPSSASTTKTSFALEQGGAYNLVMAYRTMGPMPIGANIGSVQFKFTFDENGPSTESTN